MATSKAFGLIVVLAIWILCLIVYFGGDRLHLNVKPSLSVHLGTIHGHLTKQAIQDRAELMSLITVGRPEVNRHDIDTNGAGNPSADHRARSRFLRWQQGSLLDKSVPGPDDVRSIDSNRYLIYRCDSGRMSFCGGWADRVKGMIVTYVMANLTGRQFKLEVLSPACNLTDYLVPNLVNWSLPVSFHTELTKDAPNTRTISMIDSRFFYNRIDTFNFSTILGNTDFVYFKANLDYSRGLQASRIYRNQLSWMKDLSGDQILSILYKRLFKLSPRLLVRLQRFLARILPTSQHRLVCAHVRMGRNPSIPNDSEVRTSNASLPNVWKFLSEHITTDYDVVFVMSDSEDVVKEAKRQSFGPRVVSTPGIIRHTEKSRNSTADNCGVLEKVIFDQHILMNCDVLMISKSGLSRMAAYVRADDSNLFCMVANGSVIPCKTSKIKDIIYKVLG